MRKILVFNFLLTLLAWPSWSQTLAPTPELDLHQVLSKGINFDFIFMPFEPRHALTPAQWQGIRDRLQEEEFKQVAGLGFTHIRLNLGLDFLQDLQAPYALIPEGLELLDQAVGFAQKNGLGIILDIHQTPQPDIFHDPKALEAYRALWKGLAAHYAGQSPTIVFELMNEPAISELTKPNPSPEDQERWRSMVKDLVALIHAKDPNRYIVVSSGGWGGTEDLIRMGNLGMPRLIYSFHQYLPFIFTHQGATWMDKSLSTLRNIHYPVPESEVKAAWDAAKKAGYQEWPFQSNPHGFNQKDMAQSLQAVFDFGKKENLTLYCGEFGVHKPYAPPQDRARWLKDMTDILGKNGIDWAMWAYHAGFDLVDERGNPDPAIVKALGLSVKK